MAARRRARGRRYHPPSAFKRRPGADYGAVIESRRLSKITGDYVPRFFATVRMVEAAPAC